MFGRPKQADLDHRIRSYLVKRLLPLVKTDLASCEVKVPLSGVNSIVRLVHIRDGEGYVVRVFPRSERRRARALARAYELLRANGVSVPEIVDWVENYSRSGLTIYAERLIEGLPLSRRPFDPARADRLAELLIPLHRAKSPQWGAPGEPRRGDFSAYLFKRAINRLRRVRKGLTRATDPKVFRKIRDWFANERYRLGRIARFDLTHDKINPGNILWSDAEKRFYLLDLATVRYGIKTKDLVVLYHEILRNDADAVAEFERVYFNAFSEEERREHESLRRWFHAYYHLAEAASQIKRARTATEQLVLAEARHYEKFFHHWQELLRIVSE